MGSRFQPAQHPRPVLDLGSVTRDGFPSSSRALISGGRGNSGPGATDPAGSVDRPGNPGTTSNAADSQPVWTRRSLAPHAQQTPAALEIAASSSLSLGSIPPGVVALRRRPAQDRQTTPQPVAGWFQRWPPHSNLPVVPGTEQIPVCNEHQACGDDARRREES